MKHISFILLSLCVAMAAKAQSNEMMKQLQNMTPEQQQQMMQQMQQQGANMMQCYQKIDQAEMNKLKTEAEALQAEIKALCAAGKRSEAEATAMRKGMDLQNRDVIKQLQSCGQPMQEMAKMWTPPVSGDGQRKHLCD